jgi:hypothetical protein
MTTKDYSDPAVWADFLNAHGYPSDTPAPSAAFHHCLVGASDTEGRLHEWARQHDPAELRRIEQDHRDARREACEQSAEFLNELDLDR